MDRKLHLILCGVGSIVTLTPTPPMFSSRAPIMNDLEAQADDWRQVGDDLQSAMEQHVAQTAG